MGAYRKYHNRHSALMDMAAAAMVSSQVQVAGCSKTERLLGYEAV